MMKLTSCDNCGAVLDAAKLNLAKDIHEEDGSINDDVASYNQKTREYAAFVPCPVCKEPVFKEEK